MKSLALTAAAFALGGMLTISGGNTNTETWNVEKWNKDNCLIYVLDCSRFPIDGLPGIEFPGNQKPDETPKPETPDTETPDTEAPDTEAPDTEGESSQYAKEVLLLVNEERAKAGLKPLSANNKAEEAANVRAKEIQTSFSHTRPDGSNFASALTAAGVSYRGAGENIAWGQKTPKEVVTAWMNSEGHRANILNASFTEIGIGHAVNQSGVHYWTQLFTY